MNAFLFIKFRSTWRGLVLINDLSKQFDDYYEPWQGEIIKKHPLNQRRKIKEHRRRALYGTGNESSSYKLCDGPPFDSKKQIKYKYLWNTNFYFAFCLLLLFHVVVRCRLSSRRDDTFGYRVNVMEFSKLTRSLMLFSAKAH